MSQITFFTAVEYGNTIQKTPSQQHLEVVDSYFYLGGKKACVVDPKDHSVEWVDRPQPFWVTALKVASYFTVVLPVIMLVAKAILRSGKQFHLVKNDPNNSLPSTPLKKKSSVPTLNELKVNITSSVGHLETLAGKLKQNDLVEGLSEKIQSSIKNLAHPLTPSINKDNLSKWNQVITTLLDPLGQLRDLALEEQDVISSQYLTSLKSASQEIDTVIAWTAEAYYSLGDKISVESLANGITFKREIKEIFLTAIAETYYQEENRKKVLEIMENIVNDTDAKGTFISKVAMDYYEKGKVQKAIKTANLIDFDVTRKDELLKIFTTKDTETQSDENS